MLKKNIKNSLIVVILYGIFYWPVALGWALVYGVIGGLIYKYISCWVEWRIWIKQEIREWKRYHGYEKYIDWLEVNEYSKKDIDRSYLVKSRAELEKMHPKAPFPFYKLFLITVRVFVKSFFRMIIGMVEGPIVIFYDCREFWRVKILGRSDTEYIEQILEIERKIENGDADFDRLASSFSHIL